MIIFFRFAAQTIIGWTVITCSMPAEDLQRQVLEGLSDFNYYCALEVDGRKFGLVGMFFERDEGTGLEDLLDQLQLPQGDYQ